MEVHLEAMLIATQAVILCLGGAITFFALKAYRRTGSPALRALGVGFSFVTLGALFGGIVHQLLAVSLEAGILVNSVLTAVGFGVLTYSLFID